MRDDYDPGPAMTTALSVRVVIAVCAVVVAGCGGAPGETYFSLGDRTRTVFVTAVPGDDGYRVRLEALVER